MHGVFWGTHRAALCAIKVCRRMTTQFGLTPSRFHMLSAIQSEQQDWFPQRGLRELLGVSAQTISRMIQSLVERGFLVKRVMEADRRRRELAFTRAGKARFSNAFTVIVEAGLGTHVAARALTDPGWPSTPEKRAAAIAQFNSIVSEFRFGLLDTALFDYSPENAVPAPVYDTVDHAMAAAYQDSTPDLMDLDDDDYPDWCVTPAEQPGRVSSRGARGLVRRPSRGPAG
jgi:DNA-binding MarR family transcriptional regulator